MKRERERKRTGSLNRIWPLLSCNRQIIATGNRCCGVQGDEGGALSVVGAISNRRIQVRVCVGVGVCVSVCPFDWAHMCSPAVVGLQEHLKTPFNPACPLSHTHTHTHTQYTADREQVQLSLYCVCVCVYVLGSVSLWMSGFMSSE